MKTNYLHIENVHTWQDYKDTVYIGCSVYDEALGIHTEVMLKIPASMYLEEFAGELKTIVKDTYKKHLDSI